MMADEELGDEVKVFRRDEDADDDPMGETSEQQLADDKKEAVMEAELDTATGGRNPLIGSIKQEPYVKAEPSPSFPLMPGLIPAQFSPAFPMMLPILMQSPYALRSPSFMPLMGAALSPSFGMFPTSPFFSPAAAALVAQQQRENAMPLQMRAGPLNPLNHPMRMPPYMPMNPNGEHHRKQGGGKVKKEDHIKKPLNAFMWFMKENRKKLLDEIGNHEKQSAELNKELGKRWHDLPKEEQQKYFEMAKKDREDHKEKYPQWSARENYAVNKKKIKKRRDKSVASENSDQKKCRARFGVNNQEMWCKFCKRKKKCEYATDRSDDPSEAKDNKSEASSSSGTPSPNVPMMAGIGMPNPQLSHAHMQAMLMQMQLSQSLGPSPLATSTVGSQGISPIDANASDSESDVDDDEEIDPTITQQTHEVIMQESVCML